MEKNRLKVVFMGTADFGIPTLKEIFNSEHEVVGVVTLKDRKSGRGYKLVPSPIKKLALELGLELLEIDSPKDVELVDFLNNKQPDISVVVAFQILPKNVIDIPKFGTVNLHASLLPKYRGPAPINHAIINGEKESGVTVFFLNEKIDDGDIILQEVEQITNSDNVGTLYEKLSNKGAKVVKKALDLISNGDVKSVKQDLSLATKAPKIFKQDTIIDWAKSSVDVWNFIRGMSPYPGAMTYYKGKQLKIVDSVVYDGQKPCDSVSGEIVVVTKKELVVACGSGLLSLKSVKPQGKQNMSIESFINGYKPKRGEIFDKGDDR